MNQTLRAAVCGGLYNLVHFITVMWQRLPPGSFRSQIRFGLQGLIVLALATVLPVHAQAPDRVKVFVSFAQTPSAAEQALVTGAGGTIHHSYTIVPAIAVTLPETAVGGLLRNPQVTGIEPVRQVRAIDHASNPPSNQELAITWGVAHIGSGAVHSNGNVGNSVLVAVIDTGIDCNHPDLFCAATGYDFAYNDSDPADGDSHGTHVAGTIAAIFNGAGVVGVAPEAGLVPLKVLDDSGNGDWADVVAALQWISDFNNNNAVGDPDILVTNNSYTDSANPGSTVTAAFQNIYDQGVLHIGAAGNSGKRGRFNTMGYPARLSSVVAVAATDELDARASFSSVGDEMEISAPGVDINSTMPNGNYGLKNGTSMASPHVAGVAALVIAAGITGPDAIRQQLQNTADDLGNNGRDRETGYGLVDADEAAGVTGNLPPTATFTYNCTNLSCNFDASASSDGDSSIVGYDWNFGDGNTGSGVTTTHTYASGATYTVTLTVTDDGGLTDTDSQDVTVSTGGGTGGEITLNATGYKVKGRQNADLTWSGASSTNIDVYRDAAIIATTANSGAYTDNIGNRGGGSYVYEICEEGTSTCSNQATVNF